MKRILLMTIFVLTIQQSFACDICGCSSGNYFIGPFPQFSKHFIGLRYSFRNYNTVLKNDKTQFSHDFYQTTELLGGIKVSKRWEFLAFVPYNSNHSTTDDGNKQSNGFGDIAIIGNYNLLDKYTMAKDTETVRQQLWFGAGFKIPTGKFQLDTSELISSANNQAGTGSFDFLLNATYSFQIKSWGLSANANYKINQSAANFKFGNRFSATTFVFSSFHSKQITFSPNIGLLYENLNENTLGKEIVANTGGNALLTAAGLETRFTKFTIGFNAQLPLVQNISDGQTTIKVRGMLHLSYMF